MSPTASAGLAADLARAYQSHGPRPQGSGASSASRRGGASSAQQSRGRSPLGKTLHPAAGLCVCPQCLAGPHSPVRHPMDMCKRRDLQWHAPSPYLEDLTKSLVVSQPSRRKVQLVPPRRYPAATSPYENLREARTVPRIRAHLQTEIAERHLRRLWDQEAAAAAARCGVDLHTYTTLLELQHRDITPEDYDVLQQLDTSTKPKTLTQGLLDARFPAWVVPESGPLPPTEASHASGKLHASRNLLDDFGRAAEEGALKADRVLARSPPHQSDGEPEEAAGGKPTHPLPERAPHPGEGEDDKAARDERAVTADAGSAEADAAAAPPAETTPEPAEAGDEEEQAAALSSAPSSALEGGDEQRCSICLEKFVCGQMARSLPCSHFFHAHCIDAWLTQSSRACPEDGLPVLPEDEANEAVDADASGCAQNCVQGAPEGLRFSGFFEPDYLYGAGAYAVQGAGEERQS